MTAQQKGLKRTEHGALYELPEGWTLASLEESFDIVLGQSPPSSTYNLNGNGLPFYQGKSEFGNLYPTPQKWCIAPKKISEKGDVLISVRAPVGPTNICLEKSCIGRGLAAIRPLGGIETFFALYLLRAFENIIAGKGTGTTFSAITGDKLKKFHAPIPPLSEQRAIVSKIEQLFSDLDNGIDNFKKAQEQLKRYRQSVLKAACEGRLVPTEAELACADGRDYEPADVLLARILEERREKWNGRGKYKEPAAPDTTELPELPEGWCSANVGQMTDSMKNGIYKPKEFYAEGGFACLRMYNIDQGKIVWNDIKRMNLTKEEIDKYLLVSGDLLVNRVNSRELVGKAAVISSGIEKCVFESKNIRVRVLNKVVNPYYLCYHFTLAGTEYFNRNAQQVVGMASISQPQIARFPVLLPPLAEQHRIVAEVECRLSICDKMEATIAESLEKAESLRQSILKKAFEGKLLNAKELEEAGNAPDWEPAEKLVERIRQEKQIKENNNKTTRRKTHG